MITAGEMGWRTGTTGGASDQLAAAQVARAVGVGRRQADELLLARRLGDGVRQGRAAVGGIDRRDGRPERPVRALAGQVRADRDARRRAVESGQRRTDLAVASGWDRPAAPQSDPPPHDLRALAPP